MNKVLSDELQPETVWTPRHVNTQGKPVARVCLFVYPSIK